MGVSLISRRGTEYGTLFKMLINNELTEITSEMLDGITSIRDNAFKNNAYILNVTIPNSVNSIGKSAFYYCTALTSVTVQSTTPPTLGSSAFSGTSENLVIYVPADSVDTYKAATNWSNYASKIQAIQN